MFVLTTGETCSASEAIMNGLRGVDVQVIQIGAKTCGKPYGFYDFDNCGTTYFSLQFRAVNAKSQGEYTDGFTPANAPADTTGERVPGCADTDEVDEHQLGESSERMLSTALAYRASGECPAATALGQAKMSGTAESVGEIVRAPYREIRRMRPEDLAP